MSPLSSTGRASASSVEIGIERVPDGLDDVALPRVAELVELERREGRWARRHRPRALDRDDRGFRRGAAVGGATGLAPGARCVATAGAAPTPAGRASSSSRRWASDSREMSAWGRVTLTSASSSGSRGSPPWRMSSTAIARRSIRRSTVGSGSWFACSRSRSRVSSVTGSDSGNVTDVLDEQQLAEVLDQIVDEPADVLALLGELLDLDEGAGGVAVDDRVAEPEERVLLDPADELEHVLDGDRAAGGRGELVEGRDGVAERAVRAARDQRERSVGRVDALAVADATEDGDELLQAGPLEDERLAARADGREHACEIGRAEDEDEVGRGLLDQLQQGVPRLRA